MFPPGLFAIQLARTYRSDEDTVGWFGRGWATVYETTVVADEQLTTIVAPVGLAPLWTPEAPLGWDVAGGAVVEREGENHVLRWPTGEKWQFDESGNLAVMTSPYGAAVTITREPDSVMIESSQGVTINLSVSAGHVVSADSSDGRQATYEYSGDRLTAVDAPGIALTYRYDDEGRMLESESPAGITSTSYADGRVSSQRTASGQRFGMAYAAEGTEVASERRSLTYMHDSDGRLVRVRQGDSDVLAREYDTDGRLTSSTEYALPSGETVRAVERRYVEGLLESETVNGVTTTYDYDDLGRVTRVVGPTSAAFEYAAEEPLPGVIVASDGGRSELDSVRGFVVGVTDATGASMRTVRDALGNPIESGRSAGAMWVYEFDAEGNVTKTASPTGRTWTAQWAPRSTLLEERDPLGRVTTYRYDDAGRLISEMLPGRRTTERRYNGSGELSEVIGPDGQATRYEYDTDGRLATIIEPGDRAWRVNYSEGGDGGQTVMATAPDGVSVTTTFDSAGREIERRALEPDGSLAEWVSNTYEFDRLVAMSTRRGSSELIVSTSYDEFGQIISTATTLDGRSAGGQTYEYSHGRIVAATSGSESASYSYDVAGRLVEVQSGNDTWVATYRSGELVTTRHNAEVTEIERDRDSRAVAFVGPDGVTTRWNYDGADRPVTRSVADSVSEFVWSDAGQLSEYRASTGAVWSWTYNEVGQLVTANEPGGTTTSYEYELGAVTRIQSAGGGRDRDDKYSYDARGRLRAADTDAGNYEYVYDATDRVVGIDSDHDDEEVWTLNAAGQVVEVGSGSDTYAIEYTADGQIKVVRGPDEQLLEAIWADGHLESVEVDNREPLQVLVDSNGRLGSVTWDDDSTVDVAWNGPESFTVSERGMDQALEYTVTDGVLTAFAAGGSRYATATQDNGYLESLSLTTDEIDGEVRFDQLGRPATLKSDGLTSSVTYDAEGRVSSVLTSRSDGDPQRSVVTYDDEGRHVDGEDDLINALFDDEGALRQSLPSALANPLSAGSDGVGIEGALLIDGARPLLDPEPHPFTQVSDAVTSSTPQLVSPIGVRNRGRLAEQMVVAEITRLSPVVAVNGAMSVRIPIINPQNGSVADYNPFVDAAPSGLALGVLAQQAGGGGSLLDRAVDTVGDTAGGVISLSVDVGRFVVTNPIARLVLSTASVVVAGVACAPTSGLACAPFAALAVGLLAGDATLTLANAVPAALSNCPAGRLADCGINIAHAALAGTQLFLAGNVAAALLRVADRAVAEAAAQGAAAAIASGESGVARTELLVALRGGRIAAREVPACVEQVCARFDLVVRRLNGRLAPVEVKNGAAARFTVNQTRVYPMLDTTAAYLPYGLLNGGSPQTLLVGRPIVHHWNTPLPIRLP